jgi:hypothetical protein
MPDQIKLSSTLPGGDANGLGVLASDMVESPHDVRLFIGAMDCKFMTTNADTGEIIPTGRYRWVEAVRPEDYAAIRQMRSRALKSRTGREALPGMEDED